MTRKVLIADDEENIVLSLEFLLRSAGFEVLVAGDGEAALRMVAAHRPELVLLDVMMPLCGGYEVCRRIRAQPDLHGTKVVMLTAKGREAEQRKGLAAGADLYISKPFSTSDLLRRIAGLLAG